MRHTGIILAALLVAGCGASNAAQGTNYTSAAAVAKAAGCKQAEPTPPGEVTLYATDEVQCQAKGFALVDWFKDSDALANFKTASTGGGYQILYGSNWAISCVGNPGACQALQRKLGGTLD